jgi:hypothetical protein
VNALAIDVYFGKPGAGKSTLCAWIAREQKKKGFLRRPRDVFCNFNVENTKPLDIQCLGSCPPPEGSYLIIDEAGIEYNSRHYKSMSKDVIKYFKLHRHLKHDIALFSQSHEDMDITLRRLAKRFWIVSNIFGTWIRIRQIQPFLTFNETSHQIEEGYQYTPWLLWQFLSLLTFRRITPPARWVYMPSLYWRFDSFEHPYTDFQDAEVFHLPKPKSVKNWVSTRRKPIILALVVLAMILLYQSCKAIPRASKGVSPSAEVSLCQGTVE